MVAVDDRDGTIYNPQGIDGEDLQAPGGERAPQRQEECRRFPLRAQAIPKDELVHVNGRLCEAIQSNDDIIPDIAASWPQVTKTQIRTVTG